MEANSFKARQLTENVSSNWKSSHSNYLEASHMLILSKAYFLATVSPCATCHDHIYYEKSGLRRPK